MKQIILIAIAGFIGSGIYAQQTPSAATAKDFIYKLIPAAGKTWGYDIYYKGKLKIHQPTIPAVPGNKGFITKTSAVKVAKKVMEKIRKGQNPPGISVEEMKQLGVIPKG